MSKITHAARARIDSLAEDARAFMASTACAAGQKVGATRELFDTALENTKEMACNARDKVVEGARTTDHAVREHPYHALAISAAAGGILGFLVTRIFRNTD